MQTPQRNILHIISDLRRGGRERQLSLLAYYLNSNYKNHILAFHKTDSSYLNQYDLNVEYTRKGKINRVVDIWNYIKKNKIDLIHTWGNNETIYALPASKLTSIPLLNGSIGHGIRKNSISHLFRSFVLKKSKYVLANSMAGIKANKIKIDKSRHFTIYNGIEEKFFTCFNIEKRKQLNIEKKLSNDGIVLISIANFVPFKTILHL